ncbi:Uu.00g088570.m01.CDS01 [Anthostomella pinea]|uniref:Uu.00g088570.m01.CDS01 n=1 Tax=Anthostomella pinea TaxID=933095 RepID=A0AAI8VMG7_9PEZI|nr:Uu.00g088570.m01.CDS01 [Anthostomella pinea]
MKTLDLSRLPAEPTSNEDGAHNKWEEDNKDRLKEIKGDLVESLDDCEEARKEQLENWAKLRIIT